MTTVNSPVYRRRVLEEFVAAEDGESQYQETDDEQDSRGESGAVTWDSEPEEARGRNQQSEAVTVVSSSPSTSDSGLSDSRMTPSSTSSTAASSFAESLVVPPKPQEWNDSSGSAADETVVSEILRKGEAIEKAASVDTVSQIPDGKGTKVAPPSSSSGQSALWRKFKGKHLRSSLDSGTGVRKERSGIGRVFSSSNKNKSSTSSDRTVAGVLSLPTIQLSL
jgi:hypothetical protein